MPRLLFVEDDPAYRKEIQSEVLDRLQCRPEILIAGSGEEASEILAAEEPDLVLLDMKFPATREEAHRGRASLTAGEELLAVIRKRHPRTRVVILSSQDKEAAIALLFAHREIRDYLFKDATYDELAVRLHKQLETLLELAALRPGVEEELVGNSLAMQKVKRILEKMAREKATVLILGASGTGKELIARRIHALSPRASGPFVKVNCAAFSENVLESELFGHVKGAFTGAVSTRQGRFEAANGGTLFLDEIGDANTTVQVKLLRFLQEREFEPVGSNCTRKVDVRLLCATNRDLEAATKAGTFREDFYYRIRVLPVQAPALSERREDIPLLVDHFVGRMNAERVDQVRGLTDGARRRLASHAWPGNVRELQNVLQHAAILSDDGMIREEDLMLAPLDRIDPDTDSPGRLRNALLNAEKQLILESFERHAQDIQKTADELGVDKRTMHNKLNLHRISRSRKRFDDAT